MRLRLVIGVMALAALASAAVPAWLVQEASQPTDQHKFLQEGVGEWEGTLTLFAADLAQEPIAATEVVEGIGPFFTQSRFECDLMGVDYLGTGCVGYDRSKKKFIGTWIDNMSDYLAVMEGEMDAKTRTLVMRWKAPDMSHASGELVSHRAESVYADDSYKSTFYAGEGDGTKVMVIEMKRKAKKASEAKGGK